MESTIDPWQGKKHTTREPAEYEMLQDLKDMTYTRDVDKGQN